MVDSLIHRCELDGEEVTALLLIVDIYLHCYCSHAS